MLDSGLVGLVANPASARDIRRLVADGSAVTTNDKINLIRRTMAGLGAAGVARVLSMTDLSGLSGGLEALAMGRAGKDWPRLEFLEQVITQTAADTAAAVRAMVEAKVDAIIVLGGDGTNRVVATESSDVPLVSISTGTNNAFPRPVEPTVAGLAAGLLATGVLPPGEAVQRCKSLTVTHQGRRELGLVDVAITTQDNIGSGAVWDPDCLSELFLCFAEPGAIGLSAIGGHAHPISRDQPNGLRIQFGSNDTTEPILIRAPIAPGLVADVQLAHVGVMEIGEVHWTCNKSGVVAIDGERMIRFTPDSPVQITFALDGPCVLDVDRAMNVAAEKGLLRRSTR